MVEVVIEPYGWSVKVLTEPEEKDKIEEGLSKVAGFVSAKKGVWYMGLPKRFCVGTLYHEAHHLARFMNDHADVKTTNLDHEADAYLMESIARVIAKAVYNRKIK